MRHALICCFAATALLTACSPAQNTALALHPPASPFVGLLVADGVSVINTGKTLEDHVIGWATGQDCSLVRASQGEHYCVDNTPVPTVAVAKYCYQTLARVSCYDRRMPSDEARFVGTRIDNIPVRQP